MAKLDGCGDPIDPAGVYYVQDTRQVVGNCALWWGAPPGNGYTCDIDEAGLYGATEVLGMRDTDVPWPRDAVKAATVKHARVEKLRRAREAAEQGRARAGK